MSRIAERVFALAVVAGAVRVLIEAVVEIRAPIQVEFGEGNVLASALRLAHGLSPYPLPASPPYVFSQYGPLLYAILALPVRWFGAGFLAPRALVLCATLLATALLAALLHHWTGSSKVALLFGGLFLSFPEVDVWAALLRADPLALALALGGVLIFARRPERWPLAAVLFFAAILVKPTFVAAPAAVLLALLSRKQTRAATGFALLLAALVLVSFAVLDRVTGGGFLFQIFRSHPESYTVAHLGRLWLMIAVEQMVPLLMSLAFVAVALRAREVSLPLLYIGTAALVTASAGMAGAASNHFLEWSAMVCVGAGLAYHRAGRSVHPLPRVLRSGALLVMAGCALLFSVLTWMAWDSDASHPAARLAARLPYQQRIFPADVEVPGDCIALQQYLVTQAGDAVLSENTGDALLAGKTLLTTDPYTYAQLVERAHWSPALEELVRRRAVGAIILGEDVPWLRAAGTDRWTPALLDAVEQQYVLARRFDCPNARAVYLPRPNP